MLARGTIQEYFGQGDKISVEQELKQLHPMETQWVGVFRATAAEQKVKKEK